MKTYHATYTREGPYWVVQFEEPDISTFGRTLAAARSHARDALAAYLEVPDLGVSDARLSEVVEVPGVDRATLDALRVEREKAHVLRANVARTTAEVAASLRDRGLSTRDIGDVLGISHGRVAQLAGPATAHRRSGRPKTQAAPV